jgi:selenocysteine lyase/cysteine desulfurase
VHLVPTRDGWPDEDALIRELDRTGAKALAVSWVGYVTGYRLDLERLGAACRDRGAFLVVDAMQGLGACELDVQRAQIDVLACGGFKWLLAPWGSGLTYVRHDLIAQMNPPALGWLFSPWQEDYTTGLVFDAPLYEDARRFEVMTLPSQDMAAMGCSLDLLLDVGVDKIARYVSSLSDRLVVWAEARPDVRLVSPADPARRAGIVSIETPDVADISKRLRAMGVIHSLRRGALRFSPHFYNTADEIDEALAMLDSLLPTRLPVSSI